MRLAQNRFGWDFEVLKSLHWRIHRLELYDYLIEQAKKMKVMEEKF
jgi:hypothetical protein